MNVCPLELCRRAQKCWSKSSVSGNCTSVPKPLETQIFTPRKAHDSNERYSLQISKGEAHQIVRGRTWYGKFTDVPTGDTYMARGCECSLPGCFCDAVVISRLAAIK